MPGIMIFVIVLALIGSVATVLAVMAGRTYKANRKRTDSLNLRNSGHRVAVACTVLAIGCTLYASTHQVNTNDIGVITTFGHPDGELDNGLHFINPFSKVAPLDGAQQNDKRLSPTTCTTVRLANQSTACVENAVQWRINPAAADQLYQNYRQFDAIRSNLVDNNLAVNLNTEFARYDPLASLANQTTNQLNGGSGSSVDVLNLIADVVHVELQHDVGSAIVIQKVSITVVHYDSSTEDKINEYQAAAANTRIAKQNEQTAAAQAAANQALSQSVSNNPYVLVSTCFSDLTEMIQKNQPVPAGFSCWPGGNSNVLLGAGNSSGK
jgi:regulator of protease activity HflC (stomatin/prohibitin superfamily)